MFNKTNYIGQGKIAFATMRGQNLVVGIVSDGILTIKSNSIIDKFCTYAHNVDECNGKIYIQKENITIENLFY